MRMKTENKISLETTNESEIFGLQTLQILYKKTDEWYIEWQRVVQRVTANDNMWQGMTLSGRRNDNDWYNEWEQVTRSGHFG